MNMKTSNIISEEKIIALRMQRQYLTDKDNKADEVEYNKLFRDMSPVPVKYWSAPGDSPSISHRTDFNDFEHNFKLRQNRDIIKGRFQNGSVGYIYVDELEIFIGLYKKPINRLSRMQSELLDLIEHEDGITISRIKKATGWLVKNITPELHKLQEAFLIHEDQTDNEGDRMWFLFDSMFPAVDTKKYTLNESLKIILLRFAKLNVLFDAQMAKSFYKLTLKDIQTALDELVNSGEFIDYDNNGYMLKSDFDFLQSIESNTLKLKKSIYVMHRNDFLVKSNENAPQQNKPVRLLKNKFGDSDYGLLQYILIDGVFHGAIFGRFTFGPAIIEDVIVDLPEDEKVSRKSEIFEAIYEMHDRNASPVKRYCGEIINI